MKRYYEFSLKELSGLSEEDLQELIDIEIAYAGIIPVKRPKPPAQPEPNIEPQDTAYEVYDVLFKNLEEALAFAKMDIVQYTYDYAKAGSGYKWLEPKPSYRGGVKTVKFYRKEDVDSVIQELTAYRKAKEQYNRDYAEYENYCDKTSKIREAVLNAYHEARQFFDEVESAKALYERYIKLAGGDKNIAESFIRDAYKNKEEVIKELFDKQSSLQI